MPFKFSLLSLESKKCDCNDREVKEKSMVKRKRSRSSRRGGMGFFGKPLIAGVTYAIVQPLVSQFLLSKLNAPAP